ncbi:hypothetical protein BML2537_01810 [Providencia stuartii]|nr:hypothetical protein BML2537_01810 [Providencia stuartii]CAK6600555.1 Adenine phosphoribosyltransferase [Providencia stuartii]CAK6602444.1 Adenine phosphoribosyltransferase [Providencia stuartii]SPY60658.1 Uncharacterised protein [Providencia stuartii]
MRSTVNGRKIILKNDTTNTGGTVLTGSSFAKQAQGIACVATRFIVLHVKKQALSLKAIA